MVTNATAPGTKLATSQTNVIDAPKPKRGGRTKKEK